MVINVYPLTKNVEYDIRKLYIVNDLIKEDFIEFIGTNISNSKFIINDNDLGCDIEVLILSDLMYINKVELNILISIMSEKSQIEKVNYYNFSNMSINTFPRSLIINKQDEYMNEKGYPEIQGRVTFICRNKKFLEELDMNEVIIMYFELLDGTGLSAIYYKSSLLSSNEVTFNLYSKNRDLKLDNNIILDLYNSIINDLY